MNWFLVWLFLHILAAVIAFGPIFVFPLIAMQVQKMPAHANFAFHIDHVVGSRLVAPVALTMPVSGTGLLLTAGIDLLKTPYLLVAIFLYICAMTLAIGVQLPNGVKLIELSKDQRPDATELPPAAVPLVARARNIGMLLTLLFLTIIFLMIIKPGGIVAGPLFG